VKQIVLAAVFASQGGLAMAENLPVPPIPPARVPSFDAPVPNVNALAPDLNGVPSPVSLELGFLRRKMLDSSQGFGPGSRYQPQPDRQLLPIPGVVFRVPLP